MKTCAIVGINWGDEGKGRMVDLVAEEYDIVVRYQGGNNARTHHQKRLRHICAESFAFRAFSAVKR